MSTLSRSGDRRRFAARLDPARLAGGVCVFDMEREAIRAGLTPASTLALQTLTDDLSGTYGMTQATGSLRPLLRHDRIRWCLTPDTLDDQFTMTSDPWISFARNVGVVWSITAFRSANRSSVTPNNLLSVSTNGGNPRYEVRANIADDGITVRGRTLDADGNISLASPAYHLGRPLIAVSVADYARGLLRFLLWNQFGHYTLSTPLVTASVSSDTASTRVRLFAAGTASANFLFEGDLYYMAAGRASLPSDTDFWAAARYLNLTRRLGLNL